MASSAAKPRSAARLPVPAVQRRILVIRDRQVTLDEDLADLYGVETRVLIQQVKRNVKRFPDDFMFQLTVPELENLKSQFVISRSSWGGRRRSRPYAFTEQGVAMLSSVLRSDRAVAVNIEIMRAFVELRRMAASHDVLSKRLDELERGTKKKLSEHDEHFVAVFEAFRQLLEPPVKSKRRIGFRPPDEEPS